MDAGHFALESQLTEIASRIRAFLDKNVKNTSKAKAKKYRSVGTSIVPKLQ
jgi:hypothetical protein